MKKLKKNIFLFLTVAVTFFAIWALLNPGFFPIHDDEQIARLFELNLALESGHIPPRISQNLGFGYGYPFFNFYPSFAYYFAEIFVLFGFSFITSTKLMIASGFILSASFMYLFSRRFLGELGGFISAVLYTYAPYHSVDVYVRGALAEFFGFVFVPALFWAIERVSRNQTLGNTAILGFIGAGLILSHNLIAMMTIPPVLLFFLYLLFTTKNKKEFALSVFLGAVLGLLLSSYFWIPAIIENKYTMVDLLTRELASYSLHFVSLRQFINSPWGYGGSILGPLDGFSLEVGKIHLILIVISLVLVSFYKLRKKAIDNIYFVFLAMFVFSIFIQSYYSKIIWDSIPPLSYIQFPWRFMMFTGFSGAFLGGFIFSLKFNKKLKSVLAAAVLIAIVIFYVPLFRPSSFLTDAKDRDYIARDIIRWDTSIKAFEYVPLGIATKTSDIGNTVVDITQDEIAKEAATPISENLKIKVLDDKPHYKKMEVLSGSFGKLQINTYSFPGWKVFIDGREIRYNDENKLRLIEADVPKGSKLVDVRFTNTNVRLAANLLTIFGILLLFIMLFKFSKKFRPEDD